MGINSYAQNFEDVMLWRALGHIPNGFYIDVGAQDPIADSVSYAFYEHGWKGVHVEATPKYAQLLRENRPDETVLQVALSDQHGVMTFYEIPETGLSTGDRSIAEEHRNNGFTIREITVPCMMLADVFDQTGNREIHWLKIDVEGFERKVLLGWGSSRVRPWILVIESTLPRTAIEVSNRWEDLVLSMDYEFVYNDGLNRYYISNEHAELRDSFNVPPNIFDSFTLNGTSSFPLCQLIKNRYEDEMQKVKDLYRELEQFRGEAQVESEKITEAYREEVALSTTRFKMREHELLSYIKTMNTELKIQMGRVTEYLATLALREKEFSARENTFNDLIIKTQNTKHAEAQKQLESLVQREREFHEKMEQLRAEAKIDNEKITAVYREETKVLNTRFEAREHDLVSQINTIRAELKVQCDRTAEHLLILTQREKEFASERQQSSNEKYSLELNIRDLAHSLATVQQVELQLNGELALRQQMLNDLSKELTRLRGSVSWKLTAPLRMLGSLFSSVQHQSSLSEDDLLLIDERFTIPETLEKTIPDYEETIMPSSPTVAVSSIDELLAYYDTDFVYCAYITLLGRVPDPEGMNYYLHRLRNGISKIEVLAQLYKSNEAKIFNSKLAGLNTMIKTFEKGSIPLLGWMFRLINRIEDNKSIHQRLRIIENQYYINHQQLTQRLNHIDESLLTVKGLIIRQLSISQNSDSSTNSILKNNDSLEPVAHDWSIPHNEDVLWQLQTALNKKKA